MTTTYHPGEPVGFRGTRAVVIDVRAGDRCDRVQINWAKKFPVRTCPECDGRKSFECLTCRGRGEVPAETVNGIEWVDADELTEPPEREMAPGGEDVAAVLAAMGGDA